MENDIWKIDLVFNNTFFPLPPSSLPALIFPFQMRVFYTPRYYADIGHGHIFPIRKFELVRDQLLAEGTLSVDELIEPEPASIEQVKLVHTEDYVTRLCNGTLTTKEIRRLG